MKNILLKTADKTRLLSKPDFLIIGAQKAGTSSLFSTLQKHPNVTSSKKKEIHYFDNDKWYSENNKEEYHQNFPLKINFRKNKVFEASPSYLYHPHAAERIFKYNPNLKLIVILREPSSRAFSAWIMYHYHFTTGKHKRFLDERSFEKAISAEFLDIEKGLNKLDFRGYIKRGFYYEQLKRYYEYFSKDQILILESDDLKKHPDKNLINIQSFLDLDFFPIKMEYKNKQKVNVQENYSKDLKILKEYYEEYNEKLFKLLDIRYDWNKQYDEI